MDTYRVNYTFGNKYFRITTHKDFKISSTLTDKKQIEDILFELLIRHNRYNNRNLIRVISINILQNEDGA